jgi:hypothetical protein
VTPFNFSSAMKISEEKEYDSDFKTFENKFYQGKVMPFEENLKAEEDGK